jgi:hypothetical protein
MLLVSQLLLLLLTWCWCLSLNQMDSVAILNAYAQWQQHSSSNAHTEPLQAALQGFVH